MPTNVRSQNVRVTTGYVDTVSDTYCGGGGASPGLAPHQLGQKVTLGLNEIRLSSAFDDYTKVHGTFQYVLTLSSDSVAPALGKLVFWQDRSAYIVTTDDTHEDSFAGVLMGANGKGKYQFIQIPDGGVAAVNFGSNTPSANQQVVCAADGTATANSTAEGTDIKPSYIGQALEADDSDNIAQVALKGCLN